jgi:hypothetical protein
MQATPTQTTQAISAPEHVALRDERYAANYLGVSVETLRSWRLKNLGPRYRKLGRAVRYAITDLVAFVNASPAGGGDLAA